MTGRVPYRFAITVALALALLIGVAQGVAPLQLVHTASAQSLLCPDGGTVLSGQPCNTSIGSALCPSGVIAGPGQACSISTNPFGTLPVACPGGGTALSGQSCAVTASNPTQVCSSGVIISVSQSCPAGTVTCGNGVIVRQGQPCPTQTNVTCPTGEIVSSLSNCPSPSATTAPTPTPGATVNYQAGWNLVAGPSGTIVQGAVGSMYTLQAGDTSYETIAVGTALKAGQGYLAFFPSATTSTIPVAPAGRQTVQLPAGQFVLIGNPGDTAATVSGADVVFVLNASGSGYSPATSLAPGQGAWAMSNSGGTATITNN